MESPNTELSKFHKSLHSDINKPEKSFRLIKGVKGQTVRRLEKQHSLKWAETAVDHKNRKIRIKIYFDIKVEASTPALEKRLIEMMFNAIRHSWSRTISVDSTLYSVSVIPNQRSSNAISVNLIEDASPEGARSHNFGFQSSTLVIFYQSGKFRSAFTRDADFKISAAHEFGHSILTYAGGILDSWMHKGTSDILQNIKASSPDAPLKGPISTTRYYNDGNKRKILPNDYVERLQAEESDVKMLIWLSKFSWIN